MVTTTIDNAGNDPSAQDQPLAPLLAVANRCSAGQCPTVYLSNSGTLVIQGYPVTAERAGIDLPAGEGLVEIPLGLLTEAARDLIE
jgi:hypothetical protein